MKAIERFGAFVLETWIAWIVVFGLVIWLINVFNNPKTVEIDEKHFNCTQTNTKGIEATCTQYTAVSWLK